MWPSPSASGWSLGRLDLRRRAAEVLGSLQVAEFGFVELGLTGALVAFGATNDEAVAATLVRHVAAES
mgnify:CR=1 FL=1